MKRLIRGMIGLSLAAGLTACENDPSLDFGGEPTMVQANPSVMFVNQGATKEVLVRLVNDRNQSIPTKFDLSNVGAGITVALDENYRPNNVNGYLDVPEIKEQQRYYVTANDNVATSFTLSSGGHSTDVQVRVIPGAIDITFGAATPVFGGLNSVTVTAPAFIFDMDTEFDFGGIHITPISVSEDGHTATIIVPPGQAAVVPTIAGARAGYMPAVPLAATEGSVGLTTAAGTIGSGAFAGATEIVVPEEGVTFSDVGTISGPDIIGGGGPLIWYKLVIPTDRHLDLSVDWTGGNDLDFYLEDSEGNQVIGQFTSAHPEHGTADVTAGTYYLAIIDYNSAGPPANWSVIIVP
jgi:hypothetical protein